MTESNCKVGGSLGILLLALCQPVWSVDASSGGAPDDLATIKKDIEALKAGQERMAQDLAEIKKLIQSRPAPRKRPPPVSR